MKNVWMGILAIAFVGPAAWAGQMGATSDNFSSSNKSKTLAVDEIRDRLEIVGAIFVFDKSGKKILSTGNEERRWMFGGPEKPISVNWSYKGPDDLPQVALYHEWNISDQGHISVLIRQFDRMDKKENGEVALGKVIKEKNIELENLESINWVVSQGENQRVVAKLTPLLSPEIESIDIGRLPISSSRLTIYDDKGNLWAKGIEELEGENTYLGIRTHQGSVFISYLPFPGATKIGFAFKDRIRLQGNKLQVFIESADPFLPKGIRANVYGIIDLDKKTPRLNQVGSHGSDNEASFLKAIRK